jgi:hypothetical protein
LYALIIADAKPKKKKQAVTTTLFREILGDSQNDKAEQSQ